MEQAVKGKIKRLVIFYFVISFLLGFLLTACKTYKATLSWTQENYENVTGFKVYCGPTPRQYTTTVDIGRVLPVEIFTDGSASYQYVQMIAGTQYKKCVCMAMTAYNATKESGYSNEVLLKYLATTVVEETPPVTNLSIVIEEVK